MPKNILNVISLGCSKNLVDSERVMRQLSLGGWDVRFESPDIADVVLVNTCGFIADAKEESVDTILQLVKEKKRGKYGKIIVFGCLSQRYREELIKEIPEADHILGVDALSSIMDLLGTPVQMDRQYERTLTTLPHYAYLKISEGCSRKCSFCIIPSIRGNHISAAQEELLKEASYLSSQGVKELILIAQDLSSYGTDLKEPHALEKLLMALEEVPGIEWIRLHYAYPAGFPEGIIRLMAESDKILPYLDIPFQHASNRILKLMRRGHTSEQNRRLIDKLRKNIPDLALRTTLITGFPSETDKEFEEMLAFVADNRFERLGVFTYSEEEGTHAATLPDDIPEDIKSERASALMALQEDISLQNNLQRVGTNLQVMIDRIENGMAVGRSKHDSPEVDQDVFVEEPTGLTPGDIAIINITAAGPFELHGRQLPPVPFTSFTP